MRWFSSGDFPDRLIADNTPNRNLVQELVFGSIRWFRTLEWLMNQMVKRPPEPPAKAYLIIGLYQLFRMDRVPPHAVLNETVEAAKRDLKPSSIRFLNGVLRHAQRNHADLLTALANTSMGIRHSHPDSLIQRWKQQFGTADTLSLCEWNNRVPGIFIRLRPNSGPAGDALRHDLEPHNTISGYYRVPGGVAINALPGYDAGCFYVQDPATQMAVELLAPAPGMRVLDACAAPGGKTFACADWMHDTGLVVAADLHQDRLQRLHQNAARLKLSCITIAQADATAASEYQRITTHAPYDRILLDVPCSNTGVLNRRPDARWRFTINRIKRLNHQQLQMLDATAPLLAKDGILVYSTCSLEADENQGLLKAWLENNPAFQLINTKTSFPPASGMDGAFAASIRRKLP